MRLPPHENAVAIVNNKGGVAKTALAANLAVILARRGHRILVVDLDRQGDLRVDLGYGTEYQSEYPDRPITDDGLNLGRAMCGQDHLQPITVRPNLDVAPGGDYLRSIIREFWRSHTAPHYALNAALAPIKDNYDLILVDTAPTEEVGEDLGLSAVSGIVVPTRLDGASLDGIYAADHSRLVIASSSNPDVKLLAIVFTQVDPAMRAREERVRRALSDDLANSGAVVARPSIYFAAEVNALCRDKGLTTVELADEAAQQSRWRTPRGERLPRKDIQRAAVNYLDITDTLTPLLPIRVTPSSPTPKAITDGTPMFIDLTNTIHSVTSESTDSAPKEALQ